MELTDTSSLQVVRLMIEQTFAAGDPQAHVDGQRSAERIQGLQNLWHCY